MTSVRQFAEGLIGYLRGVTGGEGEGEDESEAEDRLHFDGGVVDVGELSSKGCGG